MLVGSAPATSDECRKTMMAKRNDDEELKPGAIWGGWWFWEPPLGKTKESPADTHKRIAPQHAED